MFGVNARIGQISGATPAGKGPMKPKEKPPAFDLKIFLTKGHGRRKREEFAEKPLFLLKAIRQMQFSIFTKGRSSSRFFQDRER